MQDPMIPEVLQRMQATDDVSRTLMAGFPRAGLLFVDRDLFVVSAEGDVYRDQVVSGLAGRRLADIVPAERWELLKPRYLAALEGIEQRFELPVLDHGTVHSIRMTPIREVGEIAGVMVFSSDITRETEERAALAASERQHRAVLEALEEGVIVTDLDLRLLDANSGACSMLGLDRDAARADASWWHSFSAQLSRGAEEHDPGPLPGEGDTSELAFRPLTVSLDRADGVRLCLSVSYLEWHDASDEVGGLVLTFRDITSSRREHSRLVETEQRLREAHEVARLASWQWDAGPGTVSVFHAPAGDETDTGSIMPLDEVLEALPESARQIVRSEMARLVSGECDESTRRLMQDTPAGPAWTELRGRAVRGAGGTLVAVRGTSQDVTAQELATRDVAATLDFVQATLDALPAHIAVIDDSGKIIKTNRSWDEFRPEGYAVASSVGDNFLTACESVPCGVEIAAAVRTLTSGARTELSMEYPVPCQSGELWFALRAARFGGDGPARIVISNDDVTTLHAAQTKSATHAALLDEVDMAVVATDADGYVTQWNRGAELLYGWTRSEAVGRKNSELIVVEGAEQSEEAYAELARSGRIDGDFVLRAKNGITFTAYVRTRECRNEDGQLTGMIGVSVDASERLASERDLRSARDYMRAVADSMGDGLCTLDYEGRVVYINPRAEKMLGWTSEELVGSDLHEVVHHTRADGSSYPAEECPLVAARATRSSARVADDVLVSRAGTLLPVQQVQTPFETEDGVGGFVVVFSDISERKRQQQEADRKLHDLEWIQRIRGALDNDRFVLFAQPIIEISSGRTVQHELLIRMIDDDGAPLPPGLFLPVAESYGSIGEIDRWVVRETVKLAVAGHPVEMNVSAHSLSDPAFYEFVEAELRRSGADPALLVFELTETALVHDQAATEAFAVRTHGLGCKLALDDFGTGYGGFTYLKQLPIDYLKIDVEFVRDLVTNPSSQHVVEAVASLAERFDLQVVAEGVEDAQTLELLREYGVHFAQGYHIGRPAPAGTRLDLERSYSR